MNRSKKILAFLLAFLMTAQIMMPGAQAAEEAYTRIAGKNRYETSEKTGVYRPSKTLVLASGKNFADALSSANLVNAKGARLKLVEGRENLGQYIQENEFETVYLVGGQAMLPDSLIGQAKDQVKVMRLAGKNRYETNLRTLEEAGYQEVGLASGEVYADALSASKLLLEKNLGLLLANKTSREIPAGYKVQYIFGGSNTLAYNQGERIAGVNRFETSVKIAEKTQAANRILVDSQDFPDALSAINLIESQDATICVAPALNQKQAKLKLTSDAKIFVVGGENAVAQDQVDLALGIKKEVKDTLADKVKAEEAQGRLVFEGVMRRMNAAETIEFQQLKNPFESQLESKELIWVLTLNITTKASFNNVFSGPSEGCFYMIDLGIENYDPNYDGKNVLLSVDPNKTYWPIDAGLPERQPMTDEYRILGVKEPAKKEAELSPMEIEKKIKEEEAKGRVVFEGLLQEMTEPELVKAQNVKLDQYLNEHTKYLILTLNTPKNAKLRFAGGPDTMVTDKVHLLGLSFNGLNRAWLGKNVVLSVDPQKTFWPSDVRLPMSQPYTENYKFLGIR